MAFRMLKKGSGSLTRFFQTTWLYTSYSQHNAEMRNSCQIGSSGRHCIYNVGIAYNRAYYIQPQARPLFPLMLSNRHRFVPCVSKLLTEPQKRKTNRSIKSIKRSIVFSIHIISESWQPSVNIHYVTQLLNKCWRLWEASSLHQLWSEAWRTIY